MRRLAKGKLDWNSGADEISCDEGKSDNAHIYGFSEFAGVNPLCPYKRGKRFHPMIESPLITRLHARVEPQKLKHTYGTTYEHFATIGQLSRPLSKPVARPLYDWRMQVD